METVSVRSVEGVLRSDHDGWQFKAVVTVAYGDGRTARWDRGLSWATIGPRSRLIFDDLAQEAVDDVMLDLLKEDYCVAAQDSPTAVHWFGSDELAASLLRRLGVD